VRSSWRERPVLRANAVSAGPVLSGNDVDGVKQFGLVGFQLNQEVVAGVTSCFKCFFDSAWHPG
jgi:hypothetical protein